MSTMNGLTAKQQKALDALLRGCTQEAAAHAAGVNRRTLGRWMSQNAAFQRALAENACDALARALQGEAQPAQVRAADVVLARLMPLRELVEIEERLKALEEKIR